MRAAALLLALACACDAAPRPAAAAAVPPAAAASAPQPAQRVSLHEWFALRSDGAGARCRVTDARHLLAESAARPQREARVRPDVHAIDLEFECQNANGDAITSREALPADASLLLVRGRERRAARPQASGDTRDHALFELPEPFAGYLPTPRRYVVDTGLAALPHETGVASLRIESRAWALEVALRERFHDAALDRLLDELVLGLCTDRALEALAEGADGQEALRELTRAFHDVRARFRPARIELVRAESHAHGLRVVLSASRPRSHAQRFEVARFELGLARAADGALRVASFDNRAAARSALECERMEEALARELSAAPVQPESCNALGILLPGTCNALDPTLLSRALNVGARCRMDAEALTADASEAARRERQPLPDDFQLTMRRGRSPAGLDRDPRYVLALFHQGQVVFHGRHWVTSKERSDGRTLPALLAELYAHVQRLDWFGRRGGQYDPDGCVPSEDEGDVITVTAAGRQRMVLSRPGCRGPFSEAELSALRRHVERVAGISGWTEPQRAERSGSDPRVEHWAVAE